MIEVETAGQKSLLPDVSCVQDCVNELKAKNIIANEYSDEELLKDSLVGDIDLVIKNCKNENYLPDGNLNNSLFFSCSSQGLENLKSRYEYLN